MNPATEICPECGYTLMVDGTFRSGDSFGWTTTVELDSEGRVVREVYYHLTCYEDTKRREEPLETGDEP